MGLGLRQATLGHNFCGTGRCGAAADSARSTGLHRGPVEVLDRVRELVLAGLELVALRDRHCPCSRLRPPHDCGQLEDRGSCWRGDIPTQPFQRPRPGEGLTDGTVARRSIDGQDDRPERKNGQGPDQWRLGSAPPAGPGACERQRRLPGAHLPPGCLWRHWN